MKKYFLLALLPLLALTGCPRPEPKSASPAAIAATPEPPKNLSLNDRRIVDQYDQKFMPDFAAKIASQCPGSKISIAIDWASLGQGSDISKTIEALTNSNAINRSIDSVTQALQGVCNDDVGRKAVASKVTLIQVKHVQDAKEPSFTFSNGVASLQLDVNKSDSPWTQDMQKTLEAGL
jgi:hypothetical protein